MNHFASRFIPSADGNQLFCSYEFFPRVALQPSPPPPLPAPPQPNMRAATIIVGNIGRCLFSYLRPDIKNWETSTSFDLTQPTPDELGALRVARILPSMLGMQSAEAIDSFWADLNLVSKQTFCTHRADALFTEQQIASLRDMNVTFALAPPPPPPLPPPPPDAHAAAIASAATLDDLAVAACLVGFSTHLQPAYQINY